MKDKIITCLTNMEHVVNQGHYLDRIIAVTEGLPFKTLEKYTKVLKANRDFLHASHKPRGLDDLIMDTSDTVIALCLGAGATPDDLKLIIWALDLTALEHWGLEHLRRDK